MKGFACLFGFLLFVTGCLERPAAPSAADEAGMHTAPLVWDIAGDSAITAYVEPGTPVLLLANLQPTPSAEERRSMRIRWSWDNPEVSAEGDSLEVRWQEVGEYFVQLRVEDAVGNFLLDTLRIRVLPAPPFPASLSEYLPRPDALAPVAPPDGFLLQWNSGASSPHFRWNLHLLDSARSDTITFTNLEIPRLRLPMPLVGETTYHWWVQSVDPWGQRSNGPQLRFRTTADWAVNGMIRGQYLGITPELALHSVAVSLLSAGDTLHHALDSTGNFAFLHFHSDTLRLFLETPLGNSDTIQYVLNSRAAIDLGQLEGVASAP